MPKITAANLVEHRERTMEALLDAVAQLSSERSFDSISLQDIAQRAGVGRTAIYNYVPDKAALIKAASERSTRGARDALRTILEDTTTPARDRIEQVVFALLRSPGGEGSTSTTARGLQKALTRTEHEEAFASLRAEVQRVVALILVQGIEAREFDIRFDPQIVAALITGVIVAAVSSTVDQPELADQVATEAAAFLRRSLEP